MARVGKVPIVHEGSAESSTRGSEQLERRLITWALALVIVGGSLWGVNIAIDLPAGWAAAALLGCSALSSLVALFIFFIKPHLQARVAVAVLTLGFIGFLIASIVFSAATLLWPTVAIVLPSILLLLISAPGDLEDLPIDPRGLLSRRRQAAAAGALAALVPVISLLYTNVYEPTTLPPELVVTSSLERGAVDQGLRTIVAHVTLKNSSPSHVQLLATALNVSGTRLTPMVQASDSDYQNMIAGIAGPTEHDSRKAARYAAASDTKHVFSSRDFFQPGRLEPGSETGTALVFWVPDQMYDVLNMTTAVSWARDSDVLNAVDRSYASEGDIIHIKEFVHRLRGGERQPLARPEDFDPVHIGGYVAATELSLWSIPDVVNTPQTVR